MGIKLATYGLGNYNHNGDKGVCCNGTSQEKKLDSTSFRG